MLLYRHRRKYDLSELQRSRIIAMIESQLSALWVTSRPRPFWLRCWDKCMRENSHFSPNPGRLHQTNNSEERYIIHHAPIAPNSSLFTIQTQVAPLLKAPMSVRSIPMYLAKGHLVSRRPFRVLSMTPPDLYFHLEWSRALQDWTATKWNQIVFSNNLRFNFGKDEDRVRMWRPSD